ncbi:hypothetical protein RV134_270206 [Roseovarius sp. EC-HK134]|nr:hypothetical protein RV134_270206 [Roseovarius sp. EC-HK134]
MPSRAIRMSRSPQNGGFHKCTGGSPLPLARTARAEAAMPSADGLVTESLLIAFAISVPSYTLIQNDIGLTGVLP